MLSSTGNKPQEYASDNTKEKLGFTEGTKLTFTDYCPDNGNNDSQMTADAASDFHAGTYGEPLHESMDEHKPHDTFGVSIIRLTGRAKVADIITMPTLAP